MENVPERSDESFSRSDDSLPGAGLQLSLPLGHGLGKTLQLDGVAVAIDSADSKERRRNKLGQDAPRSRSSSRQTFPCVLGYSRECRTQVRDLRSSGLSQPIPEAFPMPGRMEWKPGPAGDRWIEGRIDDFTFWTGVLTADEIANIHEGDLLGFDAPTSRSGNFPVTSSGYPSPQPRTVQGASILPRPPATCSSASPSARRNTLSQGPGRGRRDFAEDRGLHRFESGADGPGR